MKLGDVRLTNDDYCSLSKGGMMLSYKSSFDNFFDNFFNDLTRSPNGSIPRSGLILKSSNEVPKYDVNDSADGSTVFEIELPGVPSENVELYAENDQILIVGSRNKKQFQYVLKTGKLSDVSMTTATLKNGLLTVSVPVKKVPEQNRVRIQLQS